jgi:hypothetical protein
MSPSLTSSFQQYLARSEAPHCADFSSLLLLYRPQAKGFSSAIREPFETNLFRACHREDSMEPGGGGRNVPECNESSSVCRGTWGKCLQASSRQPVTIARNTSDIFNEFQTLHPALSRSPKSGANAEEGTNWLSILEVLSSNLGRNIV